MKTQERAEARRLRAELGMSMKAIARELDVSVSSVSIWTRDVQLTPQQIAARDEPDRRSPQRRRGTSERATRARSVRLEAQEHGRELARFGDPLHLSGCMLYWAEGSKTRNSLQLTNSDPDMLRCFVAFLRRSYEVRPDQFCLSVNCYVNNGLTLDEIESYWLEVLGLPETCLRAGTVNRPSSASQRKRNTLLYGTARITVHSTFLVQSIYGAIQEYAGIERPEWLDCAPPHIERPLAG